MLIVLSNAVGRSLRSLLQALPDCSAWLVLNHSDFLLQSRRYLNFMSLHSTGVGFWTHIGVGLHSDWNNRYLFLWLIRFFNLCGTCRHRRCLWLARHIVGDLRNLCSLHYLIRLVLYLLLLPLKALLISSQAIDSHLLLEHFLLFLRFLLDLNSRALRFSIFGIFSRPQP